MRPSSHSSQPPPPPPTPGRRYIEAANDAGWNALMEAARRGHTFVARQLLLSGANPLARSSAGTAALGLAASGAHFGAVLTLLGGAGHLKLARDRAEAAENEFWLQQTTGAKLRRTLGVGLPALRAVRCLCASCAPACCAALRAQTWSASCAVGWTLWPVAQTRTGTVRLVCAGLGARARTAARG